MSQSITIQLSDAAYQAVRAAAARADRSPEELIAETVTEHFDQSKAGQTERIAASEDPVIRVMRERGHLVDPRAYPAPPMLSDMPPHGSPEEAQMLEEIGHELSDALERTGKSLGDLVER
jgi:hypothetical protein